MPSDRKSTRLNSSHANISYAVFCLKKKKQVLFIEFFFFFNDTATTEIYTLSLHDALPIYMPGLYKYICSAANVVCVSATGPSDSGPLVGYPAAYNSQDVRNFVNTTNDVDALRSEEHTSELQSRQYLVCRLLLEKKKTSSIY